MEFWNVPRLWEGETAVVAATGFSLTQCDLMYCRGRAKVAVVNTTLQMAPWADLLYFADQRWFDHYKADVLAFKGLKVSIQNAHPVTATDPDVKILKNKGDHPGLYREPDGLHTGRNSGYQAINVLAHLGVGKIVLLGFDCRADDRARHWWGKEYPWRSSGPQIYKETFLPRYRTLIDPLKNLGIDVVNATPGSAIDWWPMMPIQEVLA